jgi:glutamate-5-semialdehyde dehydrogenase
MDVSNSDLIEKAKAARIATRAMQILPREVKDSALHAIATTLENNQRNILASNAQDMTNGREAGLSQVLLDRLMLDEPRLTGIINDVRRIAELPDPVGEIFEKRTLPNGLEIEKRRVPLGVIGAIYESRPNVTVDIATLCLKSGNTVLLRGGKESIHSNQVLASLIRKSLENSGLTPEAVQFVSSTDRSVLEQMVKLDEFIDLLIPRGGADLVRFVAKESTMPVITGGIGVCHTFIDASADADMAVNIIFNAKVQRPTVCNALDTLLVHADSVTRILPMIGDQLSEAGVELRCDKRALSALGPKALNYARAADVNDFGQEFLGLVLSIRIVDSMQEAIDHIFTYGSGHSEAIITEDNVSALEFINQVDASLVLVNASTRFNDGGELGLGAEVAISTGRLHARGPMGLRELTSYKWVAFGTGQVRQ